MTTLQAESKSIGKIFFDEYVIPEFQRKYSWDTDNCSRLWEDLTGFYEDSPESSKEYFFGSIVVHPGKDGDARLHVIDGQQRLITLSLLIKALFKKSVENTVLQECLWKKDPLSAKVRTGELRVETRVIEGDKKHFDDVARSEEMIDGSKSLFHENLACFDHRIAEWIDGEPGKLGKFILFLLQRVVLLPVKCESEDEALRIFQTINDRGMKLEDSDIFKAKLYGFYSEEKRRDFIDGWNRLGDAMSLFRIYMYVLRARNDKPTEKEQALRSYFGKNDWALLQDCDQVMSDIEGIAAAEQLVSSKVWWKILETYPNQYWKYPLFVFLHKNGKTNDSVYSLNKGKEAEFENLMRATVRYFFIKGVVHNAVNKIKDAVFRVCSAIARDEGYLRHYTDNTTPDESEAFKSKIASVFSKRYKAGLVLIAARQNPKQCGETFGEFLSLKKWDIEHILPQKWADHYYGNWNESVCDASMEKLGNLMPLEKKINISASNLFFAEKKNRYKEQESKIQDALDLVESDIEQWAFANFEARHKEILTRLDKFFFPAK